MPTTDELIAHGRTDDEVGELLVLTGLFIKILMILLHQELRVTLRLSVLIVQYLMATMLLVMWMSPI
jgi:hypothetical protein